MTGHTISTNQKERIIDSGREFTFTTLFLPTLDCLASIMSVTVNYPSVSLRSMSMLEIAALVAKNLESVDLLNLS